MITIKVIGTPLYQWEVGRQVQVTPLLGMKVSAVHFSHLGDAEALVVKPREEKGMTVADIPNVLLQSGSNLVVYSVNVSADCVETLTECVISVQSRAKPSDYVYTETEVLTWESLDKRIKTLEEGGGGSVANAVLYTEQNLAEEQKAQARENIGVASGGNVELDVTLTQSGKAADAQVTGDLLNVAPGVTKNLNITPYIDKTSNGVTFTVNEDNSVSLSGTPTADVWVLSGAAARAARFLLPAGTYTLSGSTDRTAGNQNVIFGYVVLYENKEDSTTVAQHQDTGTGVTFTTTKDYWCMVQIAVMAQAGATDGCTLKMQLEKGKKATEYVSPFAVGIKSARLDAIEDAIGTIEETVFGDAVPDYYFTDNYLPGRISTVKAKMQECVGNGDAFIFHTDSHWTQNAGNSPALLAYISRNLNITKLISGGDTGNVGGSAEFSDALRRCFNGRVYHVFGNHEYFYPANGSLLAYNMTMYNDDVHTGEPGRNYYYFDNNRAHIRYVVLDSYSAGTADSTGAKPGYEEAQISWLENTALDVPDGWGIIVFTHHMYYMNLTTMALTAPPTGGQAVLDALDAYNANENSKGEVICVVQGHTHHDRITQTSGGIPVVITACDKYKPWIDGETNMEPWLSTRVAGTITEQAFDIVVVDRNARQLHFFRIGGDAFNGVDDNPGEPVNLRTVSY